MKTDKRVIRRREIQGEAAHCYSKIINECSATTNEEFHLFLITLSAKITNDLNYFMVEDFDKNKKLFKKG
jgi:hypothetical protein